LKDIKEKIPSDIPYEKITQEQIFRNAIDAARKKRATKPSEYPNDVWALKSILLPKERKVVEEYLTDSKPYTEELNQLEQELKTVTDVTLQNRIRLYRKRDLSFYLYQEEIKRQYKDGTLEDMNFDNAIDKNDIVIKLYEGLFEKIVDALVDGGWISTGKRRTLGSGGTLGEENLGIIYEDNR
jgi:hypothetical protein